MERILITGSNRGLGLEFVRQYLARGEQVFAACRAPQQASALQQLQTQHPDSLMLLPLEVTDQASINTAAQTVGALDILINNAAILNRGDRFGQLNAAEMLPVFEINTIAPVMVAQTFVPALKAGNNPRLINISSSMGSITQASGGDISYSASKAALNMFTHALSDALRREDITAIALDPGWVQTDMGGPSASLTPPESIGEMLKVIDGLTAQDAGRFLRYTGATVPW